MIADLLPAPEEAALSLLASFGALSTIPALRGLWRGRAARRRAARRAGLLPRQVYGRFREARELDELADELLDRARRRGRVDTIGSDPRD